MRMSRVVLAIFVLALIGVLTHNPPILAPAITPVLNAETLTLQVV